MISVLIPCYNEKKTIEEIVCRIQNLNNIKTQIIIVDDCSNDGTREILENKVENKISKIIYNTTNQGKGYCIKLALEFAEEEIVLIQDADLEYNPNDYKKLIKPIVDGNADVVYGSRFIGGDERRILFFWHSVINKFYTMLSNMFTNQNLSDMETCYKVFKKEVISQIILKEKGFGFDPEITAKIAKLKVRIYEVGISYFGRTYDEGKKINFKDALIVLKCIFIYNLF
jgi:glycosyltransferase involved in cell wall biosynthesis